MKKLKKIRECIHVLYDCDENKQCDALQQLEAECNLLLAQPNCSSQSCYNLCSRLETFMRSNLRN